MKNFIKFVLILFLSTAIFTIGVIGIIFTSDWFKKNRSYEKIYATTADKKLAQLIEDSVYIISNSKPLDKTQQMDSAKELKNYRLNLMLDNVTNVCYSESIYGTDVSTMLKNAGIKYKYANLIEDKKQVGFGEGSSILLLVKKDNTIIPIFISAYFYKIHSKLKLFKNSNTAGCEKIPDNKLQIEINSSLMAKALIIIE